MRCTTEFLETPTLGQFGDFARRNLAQTFSRRLNTRVEALCQLVGRLAEVQVRNARLKLAPAVHCVYLLVVDRIQDAVDVVVGHLVVVVDDRARGRLSGVRELPTRKAMRCHQSGSRVEGADAYACLVPTFHIHIDIDIGQRWTTCTGRLVSISQTRYGERVRDAIRSQRYIHDLTQAITFWRKKDCRYPRRPAPGPPS